MNPPDKVVLEHAGALGDFLLAWPALVAVARHFAGTKIYFAVRPAHAPWLLPWAEPCPPALRQALDARFAGETWPRELDGVLVVRPGLGVRPEVANSPWFWFLRGIMDGRSESPRTLYRNALASRGIPWLPTAPSALFQQHFGGHAPVGQTALLFPGAGHPDKSWLLPNLEALAGEIAKRGITPVFILGPAEEERGIRPAGTCLRPDSLEALGRALCAARFVVGPDCGPLHLAAMHGVPGLALFGPTSARQWGPPGLSIMTAGRACSPCVAITSGPFAPSCPRPLPCLADIGVADVLAALAPWLPAAGQANRNKNIP